MKVLLKLETQVFKFKLELFTILFNYMKFKIAFFLFSIVTILKTLCQVNISEKKDTNELKLNRY